MVLVPDKKPPKKATNAEENEREEIPAEQAGVEGEG